MKREQDQGKDKVRLTLTVKGKSQEESEEDLHHLQIHVQEIGKSYFLLPSLENRHIGDLQQKAKAKKETLQLQRLSLKVRIASDSW